MDDKQNTLRKIGGRIKEMRVKLGMSQAELAEKCGYTSRTTINKIEKGVNDIPRSRIVAISEALGISISYLMGWEKLMTPNDNSMVLETLNKNGISTNDTKEFIKGAIPTTVNGVSIPILGSVPAGIPLSAIEDVKGSIAIDYSIAQKGDTYALVVKGQSMQPEINEGDIVVVRMQSDVESGEIAVVLINGEEATVKRIKKQESGILLVGTNASVYEPVYYSTDDIEKLPVNILGKVVRVIRDL